MVFWIASVVGLAIAYLFGATPTGYLAGKLLKGIDIRQHGSKSTGATMWREHDCSERSNAR